VSLKAKKPPGEIYCRQLHTLGDRIRHRRLELGLHQTDVAQQLGVSVATVIRWETNAGEPAWRQLPRIHAFIAIQHEQHREATLAQRLLASRWALGLSRKKFAAWIEIDEGTLARWEGGARSPQKGKVARVERLLMNVGKARPVDANSTQGGFS